MQFYRHGNRLWWVLTLTVLASSVAGAQNLRLKLDGSGDYAQLPNAAFENLENATFEAWIRWDDFAYFSQPFGIGREWDVVTVNNTLFRGDLTYFIYSGGKPNAHMIRIPGILQRGQWLHVATVSGPGGMQLYVNGIKLGEDSYIGSFARIAREDAEATLGKHHWKANSYFAGEIDEVRLWEGARSAEQIAANMFRDLSDREEGLVAVWDFDSGDVRDGSPNGHDGALRGDADSPRDSGRDHYRRRQTTGRDFLSIPEDAILWTAAA